MDYEEIDKIHKQHLAGQWPKFLESISINGLRGWLGETVNFRFPVTAIVGENGTGKSTLLKVAACAYEQDEKSRKTFYPAKFFIKTQWDDISKLSLEYRVRQGQDVRSFEIKKHTERWAFPESRVKRAVFFFDVARTLPLDATVGYPKIAYYASKETSTTEILPEFRKRLSSILGREYLNARFATTDLDKKKEVGLLTRGFGEISQFHQGAGEDSTLDLIRSLQLIPPTSLVIIDELEASLHPKAQRRLVQFLLWFSRINKVQFIISTHSSYVFEELPEEAKVLLLPGREPGKDKMNIVYGASSEFALSRLDSATYPELHVFVEDLESKILLRAILANNEQGQTLLPRIDIVPIGGANVVNTMGELASKNRLPYNSMAITDGDTPHEGLVSLPGNKAPERVVFESLKQQNWSSLNERFGIGAGTLFQDLDECILQPNHHKWTESLGNKIVKSKQAVWEILAEEWCKTSLNEEDGNRIISAIKEKLP